MERLTDWALNKLGEVPAIPFPFIVALVVVFFLIFPTVRRAWRTSPEERPREAVPYVQMDAGGIYTLLVNIEIQIANAQREIGHLTGAVADVKAAIDRIPKRVRPGKTGKTRKSDGDDG